MVNRCSKELIEPGSQQEWCDFMWIAGLQEFAAVALRPSARGSHVGSGGSTLPPQLWSWILSSWMQRRGVVVIFHSQVVAPQHQRRATLGRTSSCLMWWPTKKKKWTKSTVFKHITYRFATRKRQQQSKKISLTYISCLTALKVHIQGVPTSFGWKAFENLVKLKDIHLHS